MSQTLTSALWKAAASKKGGIYATRPKIFLSLLALADAVNEKVDVDKSNLSGTCWPSITTLAKQTQQTERNTIRTIQRLVMDGYLEKVEVGGGRGRRSTYRVIINPVSKTTVLMTGNSKKQPGQNPVKVTQKPCHGDSAGKEVVLYEPEVEPEMEPESLSGASLASRRTADQNDSRFEKVKIKIGREYVAANHGTRCPWGEAETKKLAEFLQANPEWPLEVIFICIRRRFESDADHSQPPRRWMSSLADYLGGALDQYRKPLTGAMRKQNAFAHNLQKACAAEIHAVEVIQ